MKLRSGSWLPNVSTTRRRRSSHARFGDRPIEDLPDLLKRLANLQQRDCEVVVSPDADEFIEQRMGQERLRLAMAEIRRDPEHHPLRTALLKTPLLPYQLDGIAFAVSAGRAILADDMGLGKTIQGVGTAEFLAREAEIARKVLIICPASLKSQWRSVNPQVLAIGMVQLISGPVAERGPRHL